ncbi:LmeA family phospholipid-binding protein [Humibacter albus]|uniref:LmeA family phospholipid-binding protein n=1 Tax=Humibacter albus TaxID=427754 RepID=UPI0003B4E4C9|nr:DUF2993 domain-containing protein [Humibacter albus]
MATYERSTEPLEASTEHTDTRSQDASARPDPARSPRRRRLRVALWVVGAVVLAVGLFFVTDAILRQVAQGVVASEIQKQLPPDVKANNLSVQIRGTSVFAQLYTGRFDEVRLHTSDLEVQGSRMSATVTAYGVPLDFSKPVERIDGSMKIDQEAVNKLVDLPDDTTATFKDDEVGLQGSGQILGIDVGYTASVTPTLVGTGTVTLTPRNVTVTAGGGALDVTRFAKDLLPSTISICVAQYLPEGVDATELTIRKGTARVGVRADDIVLDAKTFDTKGSCD